MLTSAAYTMLVFLKSVLFDGKVAELMDFIVPDHLVRCIFSCAMNGEGVTPQLEQLLRAIYFF